MKKTFLFLAMAIMTLSFISCEKKNVCEEPNELITGKISWKGLPSPPCPDDMACAEALAPTIAVVNDEGIFMLLKNGHYIFNLEELGKYSINDKISICGSYTQGIEHLQEFYFLEISKIIK
jgi:hypothetical protein